MLTSKSIRSGLTTLLGVVVIGGVFLYAYREHRIKKRTETMRLAALLAMDQQMAPLRAAFRKQQDGEMRGELSPLARVDYIHLAEGENRIGSVVVNKGHGLKKGTVLPDGKRRLLITGSPEDPAVAIYDPQAPAFLAYQGLSYFNDDSRYTVSATLQRYPSPKPTKVDASRGDPQTLMALGILSFTIEKNPLSMEAYGEPGQNSLFLMFRDETSGKESYGAGRFLYAQIRAGDQVLLDFNQAWNPLCAYSKYFHCPIPPSQNHLKVKIPVGETNYKGVHG